MNRYEFYELKSWMYLPVIFIGLLGNFASFLVYRTAPMRKSTVGTLLLILSLIDILLLLLITPIFVLVFLPLWEDQWQKYSLHMSFFAYSTRYVYPLCMMTKSCSLYLMVLITIERWIAVCRPLQAKVLCTNRNTMKAGIFIIIFSIVFNFPRFFDYKIGDGYLSEMWMLDTEKHWWYFMFYFIILSVIFDYFLPFLIMTVANYHVIRALQESDEVITGLAVQKRKDQKTTVMLLVVTIFFAFCHLFSMFLKVAESIFGGFLTQTSFYWEVFAEFTIFLIIFHTSSTFFIYYGFSEKFRTIFHDIIRCRQRLDDVKCSTYLPVNSSGVPSEAKTRKKRKAPTPEEAIGNLRDAEELLIKKQEYFEFRIEQEVEAAKKYDGLAMSGELNDAISAPIGNQADEDELMQELQELQDNVSDLSSSTKLPEVPTELPEVPSGELKAGRRGKFRKMSTMEELEQWAASN